MMCGDKDARALIDLRMGIRRGDPAATKV